MSWYNGKEYRANPISPNPIIPIQKIIISFFKSKFFEIDYLLNEQRRNQSMISLLKKNYSQSAIEYEIMCDCVYANVFIE